MLLPPDVEAAVQRDYDALNAIVRGDPGPKKLVFSHRDDVSLANPVSPAVRGWAAVEALLDRVIPQLSDGSPIEFERVSAFASGDLAYVVQYERWVGRAGAGSERGPLALRATTIFRREEDGWRIAHRQADSVTEARTLESLAAPAKH